MPLKTRTVDLREERDRLDDRLDELAEREAELQHELEGIEDGADEDAVAAEAQRLYGDIQDIREDAQETQTHLTGIAVTIEGHGGARETVATDGGNPTRGESRKATVSDESMAEQRDAAATGDESDEVARAREAMQSDTTDAVNDQPGQDEQGQPVGGASGTGDTPTSTRESGGSDVETAVQPTGGLEVAFGGLTAGEYARAADLANAAERGRIGFAESGAGEGRTRNIFVAAGIHNAPFVDRGMGLEAKADAIADLSPDFVTWAEQQIMELTSPPEAVGNGYSSRVESMLEAKRSNTTETET